MEGVWIYVLCKVGSKYEAKAQKMRTLAESASTSTRMQAITISSSAPHNQSKGKDVHNNIITSGVVSAAQLTNFISKYVTLLSIVNELTHSEKGTNPATEIAVYQNVSCYTA